MNKRNQNFRLGLLINPVAGLGGSVALKGSDGAAAEALMLGAKPQAATRTAMALNTLPKDQVEIITYPEEMGEDLARSLGFSVHVVGNIQSGNTTAEDTERAVVELMNEGIDLLLFAGGDGTARNICNALPENFPVLGIPAGVKIHSGVYAVTPKAAGEVVAMLVRGELVTLAEQEVRDIDETAFREGRVRAKYYGELLVPMEHRYIQQVKNGSNKEDESLVLADIAADVVEKMEPDTRYIMGSGSTVASIMEELGLQNTLLGVDVVENGELIASDCTAQALLELTEGFKTKIIVTIIGGQGHILGRGNQQLSPALIKRVGRENMLVVATKTKLSQLQGRPLIVDTGDDALDKSLAGLIPVVTGYHDAVLYRIAEI